MHVSVTFFTDCRRQGGGLCTGGLLSFFTVATVIYVEWVHSSPCGRRWETVAMKCDTYRPGSLVINLYVPGHAGFRRMPIVSLVGDKYPSRWSWSPWDQSTPTFLTVPQFCVISSSSRHL